MPSQQGLHLEGWHGAEKPLSAPASGLPEKRTFSSPSDTGLDVLSPKCRIFYILPLPLPHTHNKNVLCPPLRTHSFLPCNISPCLLRCPFPAQLGKSRKSHKCPKVHKVIAWQLF